ncbi:MAG: nickel-dependent hydrogenase large subunit, partial [Candidatus Aerophobus sp.]
MAKKIITIDPVARIEGHLKIVLEIDGGKVVDARSSGTLFRGFEVILKGRDPRDAQQLTQRACGICSASHATCASLT